LCVFFRKVLLHQSAKTKRKWKTERLREMEVYDKIWGLNLVRLSVYGHKTTADRSLMEGREFTVYITHWASPDPNGPAVKHHDHSA